MGFLDRINTNKATGTDAGVKKPNPLAARKNPLAARKPSIPLKPAKEEAVETKEEVKAVAPVQEAEITAEEVVVEAKQEAVVEEKAEAAVETPQEETAESTEETQVEVEVSEQPAEEETKEEEKAPEEPKEEPKAQEEKPKAKKNNRRNTSSKKKETASTQEEEATFYEIPTTEIDYAEAVEAIRSPFKDETWEAFKAEIQEDLAKINVSDDLNPGALKVVISELSILRDKIWFPLQEAKMEFERYASKEPEGLIERVKRINSVGGNNETERRRAGILACMNYETPAGSVNLYELMDESRERYSFLKAVDESIKFKKDILITMNGALKLEKELL